jgi:hypothetical protein
VTDKLKNVDEMKTRDWHFSIFVLLLYLATFHFWMTATRAVVMASGVAVAGGMALALALAARRKYFCNDWDKLFHAAVAADILIEALLIERHTHYGFYLCAAAFIVVIGGYRWRELRRARRAAPAGVTSCG